MAPAHHVERAIRSLRRSRVPRDVDTIIVPAWTVGDDSEDEEELEAIRRRQEKRLRRRRHVERDSGEAEDSSSGEDSVHSPTEGVFDTASSTASSGTIPTGVATETLVITSEMPTVALPTFTDVVDPPKTTDFAPPPNPPDVVDIVVPSDSASKASSGSTDISTSSAPEITSTSSTRLPAVVTTDDAPLSSTSSSTKRSSESKPSEPSTSVASLPGTVGLSSLTVQPTPTGNPPPPQFDHSPPPPKGKSDHSDSDFDGHSDPDDDSDSDDESATGSLPSETSTSFSAVPISSGGPSPEEISAERTAQKQHHRDVETGLTAVASIAGFVCVVFAIWLLVRTFKRRNRDKIRLFTEKPSSRRRDRLFALFPNIRKRFADRGWANIESSKSKPKDTGSFHGTQLLGYMPDMPITSFSHSPQMKTINPDPLGYYSTEQTDGTYQTAYGQFMPPYSPTESTLSSNTQNAGIPGPTQLQPAPPPPPYAHPDLLRPEPAFVQDRATVYTEISETTSAPRFRTVNSWVRQQTGRLKRDPAPPVPEQGYGLMAPDGEAPKRIVAPRGVGYAR